MTNGRGRRLGWGAALRVAWRECQAAPGKFVFVIVAVAIGVAALTGVRGFTDSFQKSLSGQARTILAADVVARMYRQPTANERKALDALAGIERTQVTEMVSMASAGSGALSVLWRVQAAAGGAAARRVDTADGAGGRRSAHPAARADW